jgi:diadenylate cyclase
MAAARALRRDALHGALAQVAPGTPLREGLDRIVRAKMGALVVVGDETDVLSLCSGGFLLDAPFSPQHLSELAKMDGAIIITPDASRIARANVHLVPNPEIPTAETGTRHRTAERVAKQLRTVPVVSVSEEMSVLTVYMGGHKRVLQEIPRLLDRASQALQTLGRYKDRQHEAVASLSALEVEDLVTARDVVTVLQRSETIQRIADEIETMIIELGVDGRLLRLQLDELYGETPLDRKLILRDYLPTGSSVDGVAATLSALSDDDLVDSHLVVRALGLPDPDDLDQPVAPRGYRLLAELHRVGDELMELLVNSFGGLTKLLRATADEIAMATGIDHAKAKSIKESLARAAETSIFDQYT